MSDRSPIEWTDATWSPVTGCSRVSEGCRHCYAERLAATRLRSHPRYRGLATMHPGGEARWTSEVRLHPDQLSVPLRWRLPRRIFVCNQADLFHEDVPNEFIADVFGIAAACPQHDFQILTKRALRMRQWSEWFASVLALAEWHVDRIVGQQTWPLPNVWLGVSCEDQATADERIPLLLQCPAAVRWVSAEPLLGPIELPFGCGVHRRHSAGHSCAEHMPNWIVVGGESGPGARPCDVRWIRSIVSQCADAGVACFVKQMGKRLLLPGDEDLHGTGWGEYVMEDEDAVDGEDRLIGFDRNGKGGDPSEWPPDLRVRQYPEARA